MKVPAGKLITSDQAKPRVRQHKTPCSDCPFRRDALKNWLGSQSAQWWMQLAHGEGTAECHTVKGPHHCAGMAIYLANVFKAPRDPEAFRLPADRIKVFAWPNEFLGHHGS